MEMIYVFSNSILLNILTEYPHKGQMVNDGIKSEIITGDNINYLCK